MAKLTKAEVSHVAGLAKLKLSEKEKEKYLKQLSSVVDFISELSEVDTTGLEITTQTTGLQDVFRLDEVKQEQSLDQDASLSGTENIHNGFFTVEAIFKKR